MTPDFLDFAIQLAQKVGTLQRSYFRGNQLEITTKSNVSDVVTRVDKESENLIAQQILEAFPTHQILGEEGGVRGNEASDYLWVVDPLDGTTNYSQGLPTFAVSIGLQHHGQTIIGVVYAPCLDELFYAAQGKGAFLVYGGGSPMPIGVGTKNSLDCSVLATGFPYDKGTNPDNNSQNVARIVPHIRDLRRIGSAAYDLCAVAAGWLDGYWEMSLNPWDVCAGTLVVQEAGGTVVPYRSDRKVSIIAGNGAIVQLIQGLVQ